MNALKKERGEILVATLLLVGAVILLSAALVPVTVSIVHTRKEKEMKAKMNRMEDALLRYYQDMGRFPSANDPSTLLQLLAPGAVPDPGWQGPYISETPRNVIGDPWRKNYSYDTGVSPTQGDMALILSGSRNREKESNTVGGVWANDAWSPTGDDEAKRVNTMRIAAPLIQKTRDRLDVLKGQVYASFPTAPPATYTTPVTDAWGNVFIYRRCHNFGAVLYSYGVNKTDDSNGGSIPCTLNRPGGDDIFIPLLWDISAQTTGIRWKGGWGANPNICASYSMTVWNLYTNPIRVTTYDTSYGSRTIQVPSNSSAVITNIAPMHPTYWTINVYIPDPQNPTQWTPVEGLYPTLADLDGNCAIQKVYGFQF